MVSADRRRWSLPPEPGPEVTCVSDRSDDLWWRLGLGWILAPSSIEAMQLIAEDLSAAVEWADGPCQYLPLIDATPAPEPHKPRANDDVASWLADWREYFADPAARSAIQTMMAEYAERAQDGRPLLDQAQGEGS